MDKANPLFLVSHKADRKEQGEKSCGCDQQGGRGRQIKVKRTGKKRDVWAEQSERQGAL